MSFISSIKSKKQKLNEKKFSKGNTPNLVDLVQSSEQQPRYNSQAIQKRSKYSGKSFNSTLASEQNKGRPFSFLNLDRLKSAANQAKTLSDKIVFTSSKSQENQALQVVQTAQQQNPELLNRDRSLFSYKVQGKQGIRYISQSHYSGRISSEIRTLQAKQQKRQQQQIDRIMNGSYASDDEVQFTFKKEKEAIQEKQEQKPERKRAARYFQEAFSDDEEEDNIVKCFRCLKRGHIAKNCIEQAPKVVCNFCQKQHHHSVCDSSPCFRCCQPGHISQDCNSKAIQCRRCRKRGHKAEKCGVYLPLDYHSRTEEQIKNRFKKQDLKKLKCLSFCSQSGHFNCFVYNTGKHLEPYSNGKKQKKFHNQQIGYVRYERY